MALPKGGLLDPAYKDLGAEAIYARLPEDPDDDGGEDGGAGADPGQCGEVRDLKNGSGQSLTPQEIERAQADIKVLVSQAAQAARIMGQMPAGLERFTDGIIKPKLNPYETLRRFITETARDGVTWTRPNRRYMTQGLYMPARRSLELKPLAVVVDTSGSISPEDLSQFESEINAILEEYKTDILLIYCDTAAARIEEIKSEDLPIKIKAVGGGGTDFRPAFTEIEKRNYTPSVLVYLTDLCGEFPKTAPEYPVLWAKIGDEKINAPFGEIIQI
jgi:predicted metal-dependent peptidase